MDNCGKQTKLRIRMVYGLVIGWLAMSLSPMGITGSGSAEIAAAASSFWLARMSFYSALAITAIVTCVPRLADRLGKRTFILIAAAAYCMTGFANWVLANMGWNQPVLLVCTFALSGTIAVTLQLVLAGFLNQGDIGIREVSVVAVLGFCVYLALTPIPPMVRWPLHSLIPLAALLLLPSGYVEHVIPPSADSSASQVVAIVFVMTAACIFNGMAEVDSFIMPVVMTLGSSFGMVGGVVVIFALGRRHAKRHHIATLCALVIALSVLVQGLLALNDVGQNLLDHGFGSVFHILVFVAEYILFALVLTRPFESRLPKQLGCVLLCGANIGVGLGTIVGMLVHNGTAATMFSLAVSLMGFFLLGMQVGCDGASNTCSTTVRDAGTVSLSALANKANLSQRELDVLALWATGHQVDYVADRLCISKNTAKTHVRHIYTKLGVTSREELIQLIERQE